MSDSSSGKNEPRPGYSRHNQGNQRRNYYPRRPHNNFRRNNHYQNINQIISNYDEFHNYFANAVHIAYREPGAQPHASTSRGIDFFRQNTDQNTSSNYNSSADERVTIKKDAALSQREKLSKQLDKGQLECLICCEVIKQVHSVWTCHNCYHVFHLFCTRKWGTSSLSNGKWFCPACRNLSTEIPKEYRCFCGNHKNPEWIKGQQGAHSCGEMCQRKRPAGCPHVCPLLCHPGACPPCPAYIERTCGCGAETRTMACRSEWPFLCGGICNKSLECGRHSCTDKCHPGSCNTCEEILTLVCNCPAQTVSDVLCNTTATTTFNCDKICGRPLKCGIHKCLSKCHPNECPPCMFSPENVLTCPCGKKKLAGDVKRVSCQDPIPVCGNICFKQFPCGPSDDLHFCKALCHEGECPQCPLETRVKCLCGHMKVNVKCEALLHQPPIVCQRKCNKMMTCIRHRCQEICCPKKYHQCSMSCNRLLLCGNHRCVEFCHPGHCKPCNRLSFYELTCRCGQAVIHPPVPCGSRMPECSRECTVERECGHPARHNCHATREPCPPCLTQTKKWCYGNHEERSTIPCHQESFSCGMPCSKKLSCGKHTCVKPCHLGACEDEVCKQPCGIPRSSCGHQCPAPCHDGPCPSPSVCRNMVRVTCPCGRRQTQKTCEENARDAARNAITLYATTTAGEIPEAALKPSLNFKTLACDEECRVEQRARQLANAFQISNPEVNSKPQPKYSDYVRTFAIKEPEFAQSIHDALKNLVLKAKASKQKSRSHSFPSMNKNKRQYVHELCQYFGCESRAYDAEPNRNVVATADREKAWIPPLSVNETLARETGRRIRVPPSKTNNSPSTSNQVSSWATLASPAWGNKR